MATILSIIPYDFYPPMGGGALRSFYILQEMARHHIVYLLTNQPVTDFEDDNKPAFPPSVRIVSTFNSEEYNSLFNLLPHKFANALNFRLLSRSLRGPTNITLLNIYPSVKRLLEAVKFDIIYYENLEALDLLINIIKRESCHAKHLYDAHNCDSELWSQLAKANNNDRKYFMYAQKALALETKLYKNVNSFFCCSQSDYKKLIDLNHNKLSGYVIPNGIDITLKPFDTNPNKYQVKNLIFCGSLDYYPNKQGLLWFYYQVYPLIKKAFPSILFTVVGNVKEMESYQRLACDPSVKFIGKVDNVVPFYERASVAVVPLLSGSGTRLKVLEAMSMGNPVVSTSIGAEGIDCQHNKHLLIADQPKDFAESVMVLLIQKEKFDSIREQGQKLVSFKYSWLSIGTTINKSISILLRNK
jgi:polysaccharide biosynthesis protein PslH